MRGLLDPCRGDYSSLGLDIEKLDHGPDQKRQILAVGATQTTFLGIRSNSCVQLEPITLTLKDHTV